METLNQKERRVFRRHFKDNERLLQAVRAVMLNLSPTEEEKQMVYSAFADKELLEYVSYRMLPYLRKDAPIGQIQDAWLGAEKMTMGQSRDTITQALQYKERAIHYIRTAIDALTGTQKDEINITYSPKMYPNDDLGIEMMARNIFVSSVENVLNGIYLTAQADDEEKENKKDSAM